jgi:hypothetical protein
MKHKPRLAVRALPEAKAARHSSAVDVNRQSVIESARCDSLPDIWLRGLHHCEQLLDRLVGEELSSPRITEVGMIVVFSLGLGSYLGSFIYSK